jgi:nicotinate-nucleotide adenylyltransferase
MRIGVFGGSFDPVHYGHLILAEQCREQAGLDEVWFIPAARPPHKLDDSQSPFAARVEMLRLALSGPPVFRIDPLETERDGPSFTADTLEELDRRHPGREWSLLLGGDSLADFPSWREPLRILKRAELVVMERPGSPILGPEELAGALKMPAGTQPRLRKVDVPLIDLSSRDIRRRVTAGCSIRFMVPPEVDDYVRANRLYRNLPE